MLESPSLVVLAVECIRKMILAGELAPGERLIEERLTEQLAISRAPLREALRVLETEGWLLTRPRRGSVVTTLTDQDVYEILTLRSALERTAFELGIPVRDSALLDPARHALEEMAEFARLEDRGALVGAGYKFHSELVGIASHSRLQEMYASLQQQLLLCMSRNLIARERYYEDLATHVERHRQLLAAVEGGDLTVALRELANHGERSFDTMERHVFGEPGLAAQAQPRGDAASTQ